MESIQSDDLSATCRALRVALCAVHLHIAWHSGVISPEAAMVALEQEICQIRPRNRVSEVNVSI